MNNFQSWVKGILLVCFSLILVACGSGGSGSSSPGTGVTPPGSGLFPPGCPNQALPSLSISVVTSAGFAANTEIIELSRLASAFPPTQGSQVLYVQCGDTPPPIASGLFLGPISTVPACGRFAVGLNEPGTFRIRTLTTNTPAVEVTVPQDGCNVITQNVTFTQGSPNTLACTGFNRYICPTGSLVSVVGQTLAPGCNPNLRPNQTVLSTDIQCTSLSSPAGCEICQTTR